MRDRRIGFDKHVPAAAIVDEIERGVADMRQHLVHHRFNRAVREDVVEVRALEVGNADRAYLAGLQRFLERAPCRQITLVEVAALAKLGPRLRAVDQHEVDVIESERLQGGVDAALRISIGLGFRGQLRGDEEVGPRHAAGPKAFADAALIAVSLRRVEMPVADRCSLADDRCHGIIVDAPGSQPQFRDGDAIGEGKGFIQYHWSFLRPVGCSP